MAFALIMNAGKTVKHWKLRHGRGRQTGGVRLLVLYSMENNELSEEKTSVWYNKVDLFCWKVVS